MNWQKLIAYIFGGVLLIILGWLLHSAFIPKPKIEIKERVVYDTVYTTKTITFTKVKKDTIRLTEPEQFFYADSILGTKNEVGYNIKHTIKGNKEILSSWNVKLEPKTKIITQYVTKDSIRTISNDIYISKPFFLDHWFWINMIAFGIIILQIIF